ncbi:MAG TPA: S1 RNA-binding domain-containing protein [Anaerolineae bacterium]|nr:S1 RNA-binding domain-containing protein [Anaerolineae bacterium]
MSEEATQETIIANDKLHQITAVSDINELAPKMKVKGTVARIELYGAFIDIGVGVEAIIHISQLDNKPVKRVSDILNVGDEIEAWVDKVNPSAKQITLTRIEPTAVDWSDLGEDQVYTGTVTRLEDFGAFVNIGAEKDGLVHISEMSHDYIKHPSEILNVGDEVDVKVLSFKKRKRRINLSIKALIDAPEPEVPDVQELHDIDYEEEEEEMGEMPTAMEIALRRAMSKTDEAKEAENKRQKQKSGPQDDIISRTLNMARE